jgi:hypothetical protein
MPQSLTQADNRSIMRSDRLKTSSAKCVSDMESKSTTVSSGIDLCKLPGRWPYHVSFAAETQAAGLGYVNCWAFGPKNLSQLVVCKKAFCL